MTFRGLATAAILLVVLVVTPLPAYAGQTPSPPVREDNSGVVILIAVVVLVGVAGTLAFLASRYRGGDR